MAYKVHFVDGSTVILANAASSRKDGAGTRFYNADGVEIASFQDGQVIRNYPADSVEEPAPVMGESE